MYRNNRNYLIQVMSLLFCTVVSSHLLAADGTEITKQKLYVFHTAITSPMKEILDVRIQEAFRRLNLNAKLVMSPSSQRALMLANEDGDGDAARVPNLKEISPENTGNLVKVPESIMTIEFSVYTKDLSFPVDGWDSLKKYHNGAVLGTKLSEKNIPGKVTFLPTIVQLVQMLDSGRIDTMVTISLLADNVIQNLKVTSINKLSPPIKLQPANIYLHKKHQALVPKLNEVLRQMKEDGFFDRIEKEFVFYTGEQSPVRDIMERRLQEAFQRIGFKFKLVYTGSAQRALVMANEDGDGDALRVPNIKQIAPKETENLILIPESTNVVKFYVYTKGAVSSVNAYKSLANFRNGFRVGKKILEKNIPGESVILPDATRLFQMLNDGRLDTVIEWSSISDKIIKENNYSGIIRLTPPLVDLPTYSLIHKKHQALIPEIVKALKEMKVDGTFEKIEEDVLRKFNLN